MLASQNLEREDGADKYDIDYLERRVIQATAHWIEVAGALASDHGAAALTIPEVRFDLRGKCGGQACKEPGKPPYIRANPDLMTRYPRFYIQQVVPHEVAHIVAQHIHGDGIKPHGNEWKSVMRFFGKPPDVYHSMQTQRARAKPIRRTYHYSCGCPERTHTVSAIRHGRMLRKEAHYACKFCKKKLVPSKETTL